MKKSLLTQSYKNELKEILLSDPRNCDKQQLQRAFAPFSFDVKEFGTKTTYTLTGKVKGVHFEIHYQRTYLMQVDVDTMGHFSNDFINFSGSDYGLAMRRFKTVAEMITIFINMFYTDILARAGYTAYYDKNHTWFDSHAEAEAALAYAQEVMKDIITNECLQIHANDNKSNL
jgi:hypothetical protein